MAAGPFFRVPGGTLNRSWTKSQKTPYHYQYRALKIHANVLVLRSLSLRIAVFTAVFASAPALYEGLTPCNSIASAFDVKVGSFVGFGVMYAGAGRRG